MVERKRQWLFETIPVYGAKVAGATTSLFQPRLVIDTGIGANRVYEVCEYAHDEPSQRLYPTTGVGAFWALKQEVRCIVTRGNATSPAGDCVQGIALGSCKSQGPWATNIPAALLDIIQMRYNFTVPQWELLTYIGGDPSYLVTPCNVQPGAIGGGIQWILVFDPTGGAGNEVVRCYLDGTLIHTQTAGLTQIGGSGGDAGAGFFCNSGSNAGGRIAVAQFQDFIGITYASADRT